MDRRRPSWVWTAFAVAATALAVGATSAAVLHQVEASRPTGEGELFLTEAAAASSTFHRHLDAGETPDLAVRAARNRLDIEAVGLAAPDGTVAASSAPGLVGTSLDPFLAGSLAEGRFAALAGPLPAEVTIDGVPEKRPGEIVYQVVQPLPGGGGLVLSYDVSELLARRARDAGLQPATLQLGGAGLALGVIAVTLVLARAGARRRIAEADREARRLEARGVELQEHNRELERARREAERALALAEETNRIRSEFVLMINHELRTPLTGVVTGAELLLAGDCPDPEEARGLLEDIARDGQRLKTLISQMLTVARIENRGLEYTLKEVEAPTLLAQVAAASSRVAVGSVPAAPVLTDPDALSQLLVSLADNAFTHGAEAVEVAVRPELPFEPALVVGAMPPDPVWLLVADDGPGIPADFLPRAFEKFEKRGFASGTGLGLYFARLVAEGLDACIAVETGPGGTTMAVGVPAARDRVAVPT